MRIQQPPFLYLGIMALILLIAVLAVPFSFEKNFLSSLNIPSLPIKNQGFLSPNEFKGESPELSLFQKNTLQASIPPVMVTPRVLGAIMKGTDLETERREIIEYKVKPGDNLGKIAEHFGISLETLIWANNLEGTSIIRPGKKLIILPVSGVMHVVEEGDTLSGIAKTYQVDPEQIVVFNNLPETKPVFIGDILVIPGGEMPSGGLVSGYVPIGSSYFICPISPPCQITQGLHWYKAVDFSNGACGEQVYAAAGGEIQRTGYSRISGNYIRILHPPSVVTYYGHLSTILVKPGEKVSQGQIIGYTGHSGVTRPAGPKGCHLHFCVRGARNPFSNL